jgi:hypothetical protein
MIGDHLNEFFFIEIIGDLAIDQILKFIGAAEIIDRDDIGLAARI